MSASAVAKIASTILKRGKPISGRTAQKLEEPFAKAVKSYIKGETSVVPKPDVLFRGVSTFVKDGVSKREGFTHATPWASVAARAGGYGGAKGNKVYAFPASKETKYYRGGALAGDPLEESRILNFQGKKWEDLLGEAKSIYAQDLTREVAQMKKYNYPPEMLSTDTVADKAFHDLRNASFETDLYKREGIWAGQEMDMGLYKKRPALRSIDDILSALREKQAKGRVSHIADVPEARILHEISPDKLRFMLR